MPPAFDDIQGASNSEAVVHDASVPEPFFSPLLSTEGDEEVLLSLSRRRKQDKPSEGAIFECRDCNKVFKRSCDLLKHEKTHSRPWKCSHPECGYHERGWPTEKERDRHELDKHSAAPPQYKCLFPPCNYSSKRESNCKQHMEKAHGWKYVRAKKYNRLKNHGQAANAPFPSSSPYSFDLSSTNISPSMSDMSSATLTGTLCSTSPNDLFNHDEGFAEGDLNAGQDFSIFGAFDSPCFTTPAAFKTLKASEPWDLWTGSLPELLSIPEVEAEKDTLVEEMCSSSHKQLESVPVVDGQRINKNRSEDDSTQSIEDSNEVEQDTMDIGRSAERQDATEAVTKDPVGVSSKPKQVTENTQSSKRALETTIRAVDESSRPKKAKRSSPKRDKRRSMSCLYRKHDPATYNYKNIKYKTCHTTSHEYISTLIRHLERYHDAILCHTCLSTFHNQEEKSTHKDAEKCEPASGCQEDKWQTLYRKLCADGIQHSPIFESLCNQQPLTPTTTSQQSTNNSPIEDKLDSPNSQTSTQCKASSASSVSTAPSTPPPLKDAEREELERLRGENNMLLRENNSLLRRLLQWESVVGIPDLNAGGVSEHGS